MKYLKSFESVSSGFYIIIEDEWKSQYLTKMIFSYEERQYISEIALDNNFTIPPKSWLGRPKASEVLIISRDDSQFIFTKLDDEWYFVKGNNVGFNKITQYYKCDQLYGIKNFIESI